MLIFGVAYLLVQGPVVDWSNASPEAQNMVHEVFQR